MINLSDYIAPVIITEGYTTVFQTGDECKKMISSIHPLTPEVSGFIDILYDLWKKNGETFSELPVIFSAGADMVKINRSWKGVEDVMDYLSGIGVDGSDESFFIGKQKFKWGNGTYMRGAGASTAVPTDIQETISTMFLNNYVMKDDIKPEEVDPSMFGEEYARYLTYPDWLTSWCKQFNTIKHFLVGWKDMIAVRYGDKKSPVASALMKIHGRLCRFYRVTSKDSFDPTDILYYKRSAEGDIVKALTDVLDCDDSSLFAAASSAIISFFDKKEYVGISLKKGRKFVPEKINFSAARGFEGAQVKTISFDPVRMMFGDDKNTIDTFRSGSLSTLSDKDLIKFYKGLDSTKQLLIKIDTDEDRGIELKVRTNNAGYRERIVVEPRLPRSSAFIGKVPSMKWKKMISMTDPVFAQFINQPIKSIRYDIDDLCKRWDDVLPYIKKKSPVPILTTADDLRGIFVLFEKIEKQMRAELWSMYVQIHFIYGLIHTADKDAVRHLLLWSEKIDEDCLPYLLIKPC